MLCCRSGVRSCFLLWKSVTVGMPLECNSCESKVTTDTSLWRSKLQICCRHLSRTQQAVFLIIKVTLQPTIFTSSRLPFQPVSLRVPPPTYYNGSTLFLEAVDFFKCKFVEYLKTWTQIPLEAKLVRNYMSCELQFYDLFNYILQEPVIL